MITSPLEYLLGQISGSKINSDPDKCLKAPDNTRDQYIINPEQYSITKLAT